jgi:hypothetical protein
MFAIIKTYIKEKSPIKGTNHANEKNTNEKNTNEKHRINKTKLPTYSL